MANLYAWAYNICMRSRKPSLLDIHAFFNPLLYELSNIHRLKCCSHLIDCHCADARNVRGLGLHIVKGISSLGSANKPHHPKTCFFSREPKLTYSIKHCNKVNWDFVLAITKGVKELPRSLVFLVALGTVGPFNPIKSLSVSLGIRYVDPVEYFLGIQSMEI